MKRKIAKDVLATFTATSVSTAIGFVSSLLVAGLLGPEQQGILKVVLLLPAVLYTFTNMGIEAAVMVFGPRDGNFEAIRKMLNRLASVLFIVALAAGLAAVLAGVSVFGYYKGVPVAYLFAVLLLTPLNIYQGMQSALLRAENQFVRYNIAAVGKPVVYVLAVLLVLVWKSAWVVLAANYAMVLSGIALCKLGVRHGSPGNAHPRARRYLKFGLKAYACGVVKFVNARFDLLALTPQVSKTELGVYSVAQSLSELVWTIPNSISTVLLPRIAVMDAAMRRAFVMRMCRLVSTGMIAIAALGFAASGLLPVFMAKYAGSVLPLRILLFGTFFMTYAKILGNAIAAGGRPEKNIAADIAGSAVNVALNLLLIPEYGILGAAMAGAVSYSVSGIAYIVVFLRMNRGNAGLADVLVMNRRDCAAVMRVAKGQWRKYRSRKLAA